MKIAYLILVHQLPEQLTRLIHRLAISETYFFIHVSKNTDYTQYAKMVEGVRGLPDVVFLKRQKASWGEIILPIVDGIREVFEKKLEFDYMFLLSGQDYPIKQNIYISDFLSKNKGKGKEFLHYFPIPRETPLDPTQGWGWEDERGGLDRIENWQISLFDKNYQIPGDGKSSSRMKAFIRHFFVLLVPKRKFVKGFKPYGGSSWWCLTRECLAYIHGFIKENPDFFDYFKYVNLSEEICFQTLILNSPFKDSVVSDDLRCRLVGRAVGGEKLVPFSFEEGQTRVWRSGPRIWRKEHFEILKNSNGLIARKFDTRID